MWIASQWYQSIVTKTPWDLWGEKELPLESEKRALQDAIDLLRDRDRRIIQIALSQAGGRSGDGHVCAELAGLLQPNWVVELRRVEETLAWLVPLLHHNRANRAKILRAMPEGVIRESAEAYLESWSSSEAARQTNVRQSTAWRRLEKAAKLDSVFGRILLRNKA